MAVVELPVNDCHMIINVVCDNDLEKKYIFPTINGEVQMVGDVGALPVRVVAEPGFMSKHLSTFHSGVSEVALLAHPQGQARVGPTVELRSYIDPNKESKGDSLHAEISLFYLPFVSYLNSLGTVVEIIFSIKDFKALLALCEVMKTNIELSFEEPTQPLVVTSVPTEHSHACLNAKLVLSTLQNTYAAAEPTQTHPSTAAPMFPQVSAPRPMPPAEPGDDTWDDADGEIGIPSTPPEEMDVQPSAFPGLISAPTRYN